MKCPHCGSITEPKQCLHYPFGGAQPLVIYEGPWCSACHAYAGTHRSVSRGSSDVTLLTEVRKTGEK